MRAFFTHPAFAVAMFALLALGPVSLWDIDRQVHRHGYGQAYDDPETRHEKASSGETGEKTADNDGRESQNEKNRWYDPDSPITTLLHTLMLAVTATGVIFIARTLRATRAAVREAEKATAAAVETARIARSDQRPWVDFNLSPNALCRMVKHPKGDGYQIRFRVSAINYGKTPALGLQYFPMLRPTHFGTADERDFHQAAQQFWLSTKSNFRAMNVEGGSAVFPGADPIMKTCIAWLPQSDIIDVDRFRLALYVCAVYRWSIDAPPFVTGKAWFVMREIGDFGDTAFTFDFDKGTMSDDFDCSLVDAHNSAHYAD